METFFLQALELQNNLLGAARLAHWNIVGTNFYQFHLLFEKVYNIVGEKVDILAEQARGSKVEIKAFVFNSVPELTWVTEEDLCKELQRLNIEFKDGLERLREEAENGRSYGIVNIVEDILSDCNTIEYLLGSALDSL